MGWQLMPPLEWSFPLPNANLQASRGTRVVNNQDGGAWGRMEVGGSQQSFYIHTKRSDFNQFVSCGLAVKNQTPCTSFQPN